MNWEYGRKVIHALFKRRSKCPPICAELESRSAANCDRSDIGMFEAGLSAKQHGDNQQSARLDAQEVSSQFIEIAKQYDLYILSQPYISNQFLIPEDSFIDRYLTEGLGLKKENRYFYGNESLSVTDVSSMGDNVLYDGKKLYFIDPIIRLKRPAKEILDEYYAILK